MNLQEELLREHSKLQAQNIARCIGNDAKRFALLLDLMLSNEAIISQRAAWVFSHCAELHPALVVPHQKALWKNLRRPVHDAVKRNTLRIFQTTPLPENLQGLAATLCFDFLADPNQAVAVRIFSMGVLYRIGLQQPELLSELAILLEETLPHGSAGFRARGRKILKEIRKMGILL